MSARRLLGVVAGGVLAAAVLAQDKNETLPTTEPPAPPPGVPAAGPDTAPLPQGTDTPAWDAIRQRCAIAIDERSCIEAARRDEARRAPGPPPPH
ncbi:MAG TPA: hypothetical protein PJ986_11365 [Gammaproteobacteria bacterium]|nr:hypothetical protein [Gammaproteobacteria bacterium]